MNRSDAGERETPLTFLHSADLHLDSPFGALPPRQAAARRQDLRELAFRMADYVNREHIPLVLLAGDLFDSAAAYRETGEQLAQALGRMRARVLIAPGNHDWYGPGSPWLQTVWPENVHIFQENRMTAVELPQWNAVVHGGAFLSPEQSQGLLKGFSAPADGKIHIGLLHGEVTPSESPYNPIRREDIAASGLTYLALGHVHRRCEPQTGGNTVYAWPGCPEGRGFDELGEKGFYRGSIDGGGRVSLTFVPFARRRYVLIEADVTGRSPRDAVWAVLPEDTENLFCRILLTGETGEGGGEAKLLEAALADRFCALEIQDHTRLAEDIWARAGEDSLRGMFLRALKARWSAAGTAGEREVITRAARFGLAALDRRELE